MITKVTFNIIGIFFVVILLNSCATTGCIEGKCSNGKGVYLYKSGAKYEGQWKNGKRNGQGTYTWKNGTNKEGEWRNDKYLGDLIESKDIQILFSGKTVHQEDGGKEYHSPDGRCYYNAKKGSFGSDFAGGIVEGKWFIRNNKICYKYPVSEKTYCHEHFRKDGSIYSGSGKKLRFTSGDTENIIVALEKAALKKKLAAEKRQKKIQQAKRMVGKKVTWTEAKEIESDDCISLFFKTVCHTVGYSFRFIGIVSSVNTNKEQYNVELDSVELISQEYVAPMYWKYKDRAKGWATQQEGRTRAIEFNYVSSM